MNTFNSIVDQHIQLSQHNRKLLHIFQFYSRLARQRPCCKQIRRAITFNSIVDQLAYILARSQMQMLPSFNSIVDQPSPIFPILRLFPILILSILQQISIQQSPYGSSTVIIRLSILQQISYEEEQEMEDLEEDTFNSIVDQLYLQKVFILIGIRSFNSIVDQPY